MNIKDIKVGDRLVWGGGRSGTVTAVGRQHVLLVFDGDPTECKLKPDNLSPRTADLSLTYPQIEALLNAIETCESIGEINLGAQSVWNDLFGAKQALRAVL